MASQFGGVPLETSKFGGMPVDSDEDIQQSDQETVDPNIEAERARLLKEMAEDTGPGQSFLIGAGRGLTTIARGLGLTDPEDPIVTQGMSALREQNPVSTIGGEIVGEAAPFLLPGGGITKIASVPGRVAATGALGATEAGLITRGKGGNVGETAQSAGIGGTVAGVMELALPIIGRIGGRLIRRVLNKEPTGRILTPDGEPSVELIEALERAGLDLEDLAIEARRQIEIDGIGDAEAIARRTFLQEKGIIPTRAQVTGDVTDFQNQQELFKRSGRVRQAIDTQEEILSQGFDNAISATGGSANRSNSTAFDFIADRSIEQDAAISQAYKQAREVAEGQKIIQPNNLVKGIKRIAGSDNATGGLASAVRDILRAKGVLLPGQGLKQIGKVNAKVAEEIRIDMNALYGSLSDFGRMKLRELKDGIDLDVSDAVGEDVFEGARKAKAKFEQDLTRAKVNKFDKRKKNIVREILENKINPDRFLDDAVLSRSVRAEDVKQLKDFLMLDERGVDAFNDLRTEAMQRIKDMAFNEVGGDLALSRHGLQKAIDRFGKKKLEVLFNPDEIKFLDDMLKISKIREPKRGTFLGRGPSAQGFRRIDAAIDRIPIIKDVFGGIGAGVDGIVALQQPFKTTPIAPVAGVGAAALVADDNENQ